MLRLVKVAATLTALAGLGVGLRWVTAGAIAEASATDLTAMASAVVGAVAWVAYLWLVAAVLATLGEQVPGAVGRAASMVAGRIASGSSRALLRSTLGVAAVTPLTIGVAHAALPADHHALTTSATGSGASTDSALTGIGSTGIGSTGAAPSGIGSTGGGSGEAGTTGRGADGARAGGGVGRSVGADEFRRTEPASTVRLGGLADRPEAARGQGDGRTEAWRQLEKPSSIRPTGPQPGGNVAEPPTTRTPPDVAPGRSGSVEHTPQSRETKHRVPMPDRPTEGAPTRYTDLASGQSAGRVVQRGDSLWSIAAAELGPRAGDTAIAARWPQWYAANRAVIGPDPDRILPGQILHAPAPLDRPVPPTPQEK